MMLANLLLYIGGFVAIWVGAGLIVSTASKFSRKLKLSPFAFSFLFLGILTSTPEFSVGLQAIAHHDPEIFVGNLLGGVVVLFLVVIPSLAVFGNGISLKRELGKFPLLITLGVILAPAFLILDKRLSTFEGVVLIFLYLIALYVVQREDGIFDKENTQLMKMKAYSFVDILKLLAGLAVVFIASNVIVDKTIYFAQFFHVSAFFVSLIVVAIGTDLPELTLSIRSVLSRKKELAMGDYVGAAVASTLLFGVFTVMNNGEVITSSNFILPFAGILCALGAFYYLSTAVGSISRRHGLLMMGGYVLFVFLEYTI